ncbi:9933_t:CDS:1, partial [Acaulospora colombiana]
AWNNGDSHYSKSLENIIQPFTSDCNSSTCVDKSCDLNSSGDNVENTMLQEDDYFLATLFSENLDYLDDTSLDVSNNELSSELPKPRPFDRDDDADNSSRLGDMPPLHLGPDNSEIEHDHDDDESTGDMKEDQGTGTTTIDGDNAFDISGKGYNIMLVAGDSNDPVGVVNENHPGVNELISVKHDYGGDTSISGELTLNHFRQDPVTEYNIANDDAASDKFQDVNNSDFLDFTIKGQLDKNEVSPVICDSHDLSSVQSSSPKSDLDFNSAIKSNVLESKYREDEAGSIAPGFCDVSNKNENDDTATLVSGSNGHVNDTDSCNDGEATRLSWVKKGMDNSSSPSYSSSAFNSDFVGETRIEDDPKRLDGSSRCPDFSCPSDDDSAQLRHTVNNDDKDDSRSNGLSNNAVKIPLAKNFCISIMDDISQHSQAYLTIHEHCKGNESALLLKKIDELKEVVAFSESQNRKLKEEIKEFRLNYKRLSDEKSEIFSKHRELFEECARVRQCCEKLSNENHEIRSEFTMLADSTEELHRKNSQLTHENGLLSEKVENIYKFNKNVSPNDRRFLLDEETNKPDNSDECVLEKLKGENASLTLKYEKMVKENEKLRQKNDELIADWNFLDHDFQDLRRRNEHLEKNRRLTVEINRSSFEKNNRPGSESRQFSGKFEKSLPDHHNASENVGLVKVNEELSSWNKQLCRDIKKYKEENGALHEEIKKLNLHRSKSAEDNKDLRNQVLKLKSHMPFGHYDDLVKENRRLSDENQKLRSDISAERSKASGVRSELRSLSGKLGSCQSKLDTEVNIRQSCQREIIKLQGKLKDLQNECKNLKLARKQEYEDNSATFNRCKACYAEPITHAIVPCYHMALCEKCTNSVETCAICREKKESAIRVYIQ